MNQQLNSVIKRSLSVYLQYIHKLWTLWGQDLKSHQKQKVKMFSLEFFEHCGVFPFWPHSMCVSSNAMESGLTVKHWWCSLTSKPNEDLCGFIGAWHTQISFYFSVYITRVQSICILLQWTQFEKVLWPMFLCALHAVSVWSQGRFLYMHTSVFVCVSLCTSSCVHCWFTHWPLLPQL